MLFADYLFELLDNGTILMDEELTPESLNVKTGDRFVIRVTEQNRIVFQKVPDGYSRTD